MDETGREQIVEAIRSILKAAGQDLDSEKLRDTPNRVADSYIEMLSGYDVDPASFLSPKYNVAAQESLETTATNPLASEHPLVSLNGIKFSSLCEHHLLPFWGELGLAYRPGPSGRVCGFSSVLNMVEGFAKRLQMQERFTAQVADAVIDRLEAAGVIVTVKAGHSCIWAGKPGTEQITTTTSVVRGTFETNEADRHEALSLLGFG